MKLTSCQKYRNARYAAICDDVQECERELYKDNASFVDDHPWYRNILGKSTIVPDFDQHWLAVRERKIAEAQARIDKAAKEMKPSK